MSFTDFKEVTSNNTGSSTRYGGNDVKELMQILNNKVVSNRRLSIKNPIRFTDNFDLVPPTSAPGNPPDVNTSRIYVDPSDFKVKIKKTSGAILEVENVSIPDSALNQITNKAKLPPTIIYNDQNNSLGNTYLDLGNIAAPANPGAGVRRIFTNTATGELSVRTSAGTTVSLEASGAGGVLTTQTNTYGDFDQIFRSGRLDVMNPANTFAYSIVGSAITAARNITLPLLTGNDTVVTEAFGQTLTTKTINVDQNTIKHSATNAAGDLLKGDGTSFTRLARGTANQVLSVNAGGTDLTWATPAGGGNVSTTASNTYGDFDQIFRSGRLDVRNPANTFSYSLTGSAITADRAVTLPLLTADDTLVTAAFAQTLTNKTIDAATNTITNIADNQVAVHTTTKISTTSKALLNSNIFYKDQNNDIGAFYLDIDQIALPSVPTAGTTRLFLNSNTSRLSVRQPGGGVVDLEKNWSPDSIAGGSIWGLWTGGARQGTGMFSGTTTSGTISSFQAANSSDKVLTDFLTGATAGNTAGFQGGQPTQGGFYVCRNQNFRFKCKFQTDSITNKRFGIGLAALTTLPTSDTLLATAIPGFIFRYSSAADSTIKVIRNDAAGTAITVDTTVTLAANTAVTVEIVSDEANTRMGWAINEGPITYYTTDIPLANTYLNYFVILQTTTTSGQRWRVYYTYLTQDGA